MRVLRRAVAVLCASVVAACGSSSAPPSGPASVPTNPGGGPVAAQHDPCALFSADQLSTAFALKFADGKAEQGALEPTCDWYDTAAGVSAVAAVQKTHESDFASELKGPIAHDYERSSPVIGDDSVWFDPKATDTVSLIVISRGYQYQLSIGVGPSNPQQRRAEMITLARAVF